MLKVDEFVTHLQFFVEKFTELIGYDDVQTLHYDVELERVIDQYSAFIVDRCNERAWGNLEFSPMVYQLVEELRQKSAYSVTIMEKIRAFRLLQHKEEMTNYFQNIESCIHREFSHFVVTRHSKVLLVGSGSFPMTPLLIAKQTGAQVIGIDIDEEAVRLGRQVVEKVDGELNIQIDHCSVEELSAIHDITHIIFSSTVSCKYAILGQLYELTNDDVVVAMRYGNGLKSLFNYPMEKVDPAKWHLVEQIANPQQIFDIALYKKAYRKGE
ncbi:methyltransferase domain-containing protein [Lysinibacillus macroides]|uniref:Ribosomal RNA methyltransferase FmrO domain protein n=1 Tax=Lysinibacillus macroides TaxID=33935 RepID=A0A0M9DLW1_9BACI|nr:methyltransferase domain-containing protein [Lysinibacillus macroides]KOY83060.1 ribosomal RNA methyltransferase FmrO domain protein [Lysinibacillus macroides]QPR70085.1 methyltransferase domain-containing protein [Lysinibacillus macroides]